jgi:hypothetical protein
MPIPGNEFEVVTMTIASRFYAGLAAFALVLAGFTAFAPSAARAQQGVTKGALIAGVLVTATVIAAVALVGGNNDDEGPQSP